MNYCSCITTFDPPESQNRMKVTHLVKFYVQNVFGGEYTLWLASVSDLLHFLIHLPFGS